jgi:hypothetical protein
MNNSYSNIEILQKKNLEQIVNLFCDRIQENISNKKFLEFIDKTDKLIDSLIDICIKNKINYYINNHISFSTIKSNFKLELESRLQEYVKHTHANIESTIINISVEELDNWNNIIDILSKNIDTKNKVSFNPTATEYIYGTGENHNKNTKKKSKPVKIVCFEFDKSEQLELSVGQKIAIYLKIIFINEINIDNLKHTIKSMCKVINDANMDYDICNPYKNVQ